MSGNVVFDENRDAMERSTRALCFALTIQVCGDGDRIRIGFDYRIQFRPTAIDLFDVCQVLLCKNNGGRLAVAHERLQLRDCCLVQIEGFDSEMRSVRGGSTPCCSYI